MIMTMIIMMVIVMMILKDDDDEDNIDKNNNIYLFGKSAPNRKVETDGQIVFHKCT